MGRSDWSSVGIYKNLVEAIDAFLETKDAKKIGASSRQDFIGLLVNDFFNRYETVTGKSFKKRLNITTLDELFRRTRSQNTK